MPSQVEMTVKPASFMYCRLPPIMNPLLSFANKTAITEHSDSRTDIRQFFCFLKSRIFLFLWISVLLVCIPFQGLAQNNLNIPELSIQTQSYLHNPETGTYHYRNAKVEWEGISVESTEILYHPETNKLTAKGYVRVTEGDIIAVMDELEINIKDVTKLK